VQFENVSPPGADGSNVNQVAKTLVPSSAATSGSA
jgi:hypothetical protein